MSTVGREILWIGSFTGLRFFRDIVIGDLWPFLLGLFVVVASMGFAVCFLFLRVMVSSFVALSPMVMLRGHGRCDMRVCGFGV